MSFGDMVARVRSWRGEKQITRHKARLAFRDQQSAVFDVDSVVPDPGFERGKVIIEDESAGVTGIEHPSNPGVSGTEVAGGIVFRLTVGGYFLHLALPWPAGAMGRYQYPLARKRIQSTMWIFGKLQARASDPWVTMYAKVLRVLNKGKEYHCEKKD